MADLRLALLSFTLGGCFLFEEPEPPPQQPRPDAMPAPPGTLEADEFDHTNQARVDNGLAPFSWSVQLAAVAEAHSQDMCDRDFFAHINPDGLTPFDRMHEAGLSFGFAAENIAYGSPDAQVIHDGWMNSPGHRANILNGNLRQLGIGYVPCSGTKMHYWTQAFTD